MEQAINNPPAAVHDAAPNNTCYVYNLGGGYDEAAAKADVIVKRRFINQRLIPAFMEPRAVVAAPMGMSDEITLWSSTQVPHILRVLLALVTGIPENNLRVIAPDVGGGFGGKLTCTREEILVTQLARKLGRPVKWTETRSEDMVATHHGRDQIQDIELAATKDGKFLGLKVTLLADMGAYLQIITPGTPLLGMFMYPGIYKMDAYAFKCTGVFTNKTPTDAYRGAGRPEATYAIERIVDAGSVPRNADPDIPAAQRSNEPPRNGSFVPTDRSRLARWSTAEDAWMEGYWNWDWCR
jgi:carbon-monoxide dehydrogenase large subunit